MFYTNANCSGTQIVSPLSNKCYNANELPANTIGEYASVFVSCDGLPSLILYSGVSCTGSPTEPTLTTTVGCNPLSGTNLTTPVDFCANPCGSISVSSSIASSVITGSSAPGPTTTQSSIPTSATGTQSTTATRTSTTTSQTTTATQTSTTSSTTQSSSPASTVPSNASSESSTESSILPIIIGILLALISLFCCIALWAYERKHRHSDLSFTTGMYDKNGASLQKPFVVYGNLSNRALLYRLITDVLKSKPE